MKRMNNSGAIAKSRSQDVLATTNVLAETDAYELKQVGEITRTMASGMPVDEIAEMYGLSEEDVMDAVMLYMSLGRDKLTKGAYATMVDVRLDMMRNALWKKAMSGKISAVQAILRIETLGMRLHGLDMGTQAARDQAAALQSQAENQARALALAAARAMEDAGLPPQQRMKVLAALESAPTAKQEYYSVTDFVEDDDEDSGVVVYADTEDDD